MYSEVREVAVKGHLFFALILNVKKGISSTIKWKKYLFYEIFLF
jgi:hypothetical protein